MNTNWTSLADAAASGDLYLDPDAAQKCARHCDSLIAELVRLRLDAQGLGSMDGFGTLPSGIALAAKFSQKAVGPDSYSMVKALDDHIAVVTQMRDVFTRIHAMYASTEQANADALDAADS